ncbi:MAG TPA: ABC transporter permease [Capillimicrobium sp.]|nr:ABC transporter permease [Capillimicrobium sp.]
MPSAPSTGQAPRREADPRGSVLARVRRVDPRQYVVYVAFLLILAFFAITLHDDGFLTSDNLLNIARQTAPITVMAVGVVFVLSAGEIDLSIGSVVALAALVGAIVLRDVGLVAGIAAGLGVGAAVGLVNGLFVTGLRLPSFLVTLATMGLVAGLARWTTDLEAVAVVNDTFTNVFGSGDVGPIPGLVVWTIAIVALGHFVYRHRRFGAHVLAIGDNADAARVTGINVNRVRLAVLVISGTAAGLAGLLYLGRVQAASYTLGVSDLLIVIAAVVIGGTRLFGGAGSVVGALVGSLIMGMLTNGLILMGLDSNQQMVAQGVLLLIAISLTLREPKGA